MPEPLPNDTKEEIATRLKADFDHYKKTLAFLECDVPIQCLCLPKITETALINDGCLRVYDLLARDLTKIKGVGAKRLDLLQARLSEFITVGI